MPTDDKRIKGPWSVQERKCPCGCWNFDQHRHFELLDHFDGDEQAADRYVAQRLREAADVIERGGYPRVFGCEVPTPGNELLEGSFIGTISVTLSHPWPG